MAKKSGEEKTYTDPITVRFDRDTFERLSRIKLAVQQMTGAKMAMSALIAAAVREYIAARGDLIGEPAKGKAKPKPPK